MYDGASLSDPVLLQRASGELRVAVKPFGSESVLDELRQVGCLKARFPRRIVPGWMDIVTLNTAGGIAAGDRLELTLACQAGAQATIASQAAERCYRARAGDAASYVRTRLMVGTGAALEWLPQETILFDRSSLDRRLDVELAVDARFLGVETLVFGRSAMGEQVRSGAVRDLIRVRRDGALLLHDAIRMDGDCAALMQRQAIGRGAHVLSTMVYLAPDVDERLNIVRQVIDAADPVTEGAASAWNGMLIVRILGSGSASVRRMVVGVLAVLRASRPLPRAWLC
jgi:urease accessory protein